jgi:membrane protein implicated in regulation of membrane protease activity
LTVLETRMTDSTLWWLLTGSLVALELFTGTFYLLMLSLGVAAGALAAHAGLSPTLQIVSAAVVGSVAVVAFYLWKKQRRGDTSVRTLRSVNLDIGEIVQIEAWTAEGSASVRYRGAQWQVMLRPGQDPTPGTFRVVELMGNRLVVEKA